VDDLRDPALLFGVGLGVVAVTLLQVYAFDESWPLSLLLALVLGAVVLAVEAVRRRRRR
jgi:hypothetical protein